MTDRELLELAAKAAEKQIVDWVFDSNSVPVAVLDDGLRWQPLHENQFTDCMGDALRLATDLVINIQFYEWFVSAHCDEQKFMSTPPTEALSHGPYSAICRAIVRAAAEIGRSK